MPYIRNHPARTRFIESSRIRVHRGATGGGRSRGTRCDSSDRSGPVRTLLRWRGVNRLGHTISDPCCGIGLPRWGSRPYPSSSAVTDQVIREFRKNFPPQGMPKMTERTLQVIRRCRFIGGSGRWALRCRKLRCANCLWLRRMARLAGPACRQFVTSNSGGSGKARFRNHQSTRIVTRRDAQCGRLSAFYTTRG